jgi:uncharacterized protein YaaQ
MPPSWWPQKPVLAILRATCHTRTAFVNAAPPIEAVAAVLPPMMPLEVLVGGATVLGFPVERFLRLRGGSAPPAADQHDTADRQDRQAEAGKGETMHLIIAILQNEDADQVSGGLLAAGFRVTKINTAGGFLRRGNVTLLIGVEADKVDDVLRVIQANCPLRTEARPADAGMPMYSATVFVVEAARFVHM